MVGCGGHMVVAGAGVVSLPWGCSGGHCLREAGFGLARSISASRLCQAPALTWDIEPSVGYTGASVSLARALPACLSSNAN